MLLHRQHHIGNPCGRRVHKSCSLQYVPLFLTLAQEEAAVGCEDAPAESVPAVRGVAEEEAPSTSEKLVRELLRLK